MAKKSDGGIVLSVNIDGSEISSDMKKVTDDLKKAISNEKELINASDNLKEAYKEIHDYAEKTAKAKGTTVKQELNEEAATLRTVAAGEKALAAEEKKRAAKEETAAVQLKFEQDYENAQKMHEAKIEAVREQSLQKKLNSELLGEQQVENARNLGEERVRGVAEKNEESLRALKEKNIQDITTKRQLDEDKISTSEQINADKVTTEKAKNEEKLRQEQEKTERERQKNAAQSLIDEEKLRREKEKTNREQEKTRLLIEKSKQSQDSMYSATKKVTSELKKMASALGVALSIREIVNFSKESSEIASQAEANMIRITELYGEASDVIEDFVQDHTASLGISKKYAYEAVSDYGNIIRQFLDTSTAAEVTTKLMQATSVIASKTGRTYDDVFEKIRSGLYGNTRAIDDLGLSVRQASLEALDAYAEISQNGKKSWNDLTDAELQQLRVLGILNDTQILYGNNVVESTSLTRSQYNAAFEDFKTTWGQVVNKILMPILESLTMIFRYATVFLEVMFDVGISLEDVQTSAKNSTTTIIDGFKQSDSLINQTTTSAKKLRKQLASFDELSILQSPSSSSASISSPTIETPDYSHLYEGLYDIPSTPLISEADQKKLEAFRSWLEEHKDGLKFTLEIAGAAGAALGISNVINAIASLLPWFRKKDKGLKNQSKKWQTETEAVTEATGAYDEVWGTVTGLANVLDGLFIHPITWEETKDDLVKTSTAFEGVTNEVKDTIKSFFGLKENSEETSKTLDTTTDSVGDLGTVVGDSKDEVGNLNVVVAESEEKVNNLGVATENASKKTNELKNSTVNLEQSQTNLSSTIDKKSTPKIVSLTSAEKENKDKTVEAKDAFENLSSGLGKLSPKIIDVNKKTANNTVITSYSKEATDGLNGSIENVSGAYSDATNAVNNYNDVLLETIDVYSVMLEQTEKIANFTNNAKGESFTEKASKGLAGIIAKKFEVETKIKNDVLDYGMTIDSLLTKFGLNDSAREWLKESVIPKIDKVGKYLAFDFLPQMGAAIKTTANASSTGFNIAQLILSFLPLATGGVVSSATPALVGEAGKEAVLPLENNTEWMDILADRIAQRNGLGGANQVVREEHYHLNQTELMEIIYKLSKGGERLKGTSLVNGGI